MSTNTSQARDFLQSLIGNTLIVSTASNRVFHGTFVCIDRDLNLVLDGAVEIMQPHGRQKRVGLIMFQKNNLAGVRMAEWGEDGVF
ncbi:hypothetical protein BT69DRAFT_1351019 [Atractiella rhizophila]|nr:hypothetical protein BT69DRAFT_1351019 [Atractiella rhizophila]